MFGMKEHMYIEMPGHDEMGKFLKSFVPLLWIKSKSNLTLKCEDGDLTGGKIYNVLCSDKMAKVIDRYFGFDKIIENAGHIEENNYPVDIKVKGS